MTKVCTKCKIEKDITEFYCDKRNKNGFCPQCKKCTLEFHFIQYHKYPQKHRDARSKSDRKYRLHQKQQAVDYKGGKCQVCGYNKYLGALEFHHINPEEKQHGIGVLMRHQWGEIKSELDKCILVCSNCHKEIHHTQKQCISPTNL